MPSAVAIFPSIPLAPRLEKICIFFSVLLVNESKALIINNGGGAIFDQLPLSNKMNLSAFNQFIRRNHKQHFEGIAKAYNIDYDFLTDIKQLSEISNNKSKIYEVLVDSKNSLEFINQFSSRK